MKGIVDGHGGRVAVRSEGRGGGSKFVVWLALEAGPALPVDGAPAPAQTARRRVLLIEDNLDAADSLREVLEFGGHEVAVAHDGSQGLARARAFRPEVVLCDIGLPGMDGYEVARALRAEEGLRDVYLAALTGYALDQDLQRAREAGFEQHLAKPLSIDRIASLLRDLPGR